MKNKDIFILGAGGMARETYLIYIALKKSKFVKGFVINITNKKQNKIFDLPVTTEGVLTENCLLIGGIGTPKRKNWINKLEENQFKFDTLIHPTVPVNSSVKIGTGSIICVNSVLTCDINIGNHTIVNVNSSIHHDCQIGNFVTIGPGSNIAGKVNIKDESFIGAGVTIIPGINIGKSVYIGAGSTVISDIPDNFMAYGTPAKPIRKLTNRDWDKLI
ncbi:MAG: acetyltransferase [Patescibacteria group bacterium]